VADEGKPGEHARERGGLVDLAKETAEHAWTGLERSLAGADLAPLLPAADLPALPATGALGALAERLDREADLFRNVALRELARVAWVERVTHGVVVALAGCEVGVAAIAVVCALLGAVEGRAPLLFLAAFVIAAGAAGVAFAHAAAATAALGRARDVEDRIFRLGIALEWRAGDAALYQDALARLERDLSPARPSEP
jgi:hypothetical protein